MTKLEEKEKKEKEMEASQAQAKGNFGGGGGGNCWRPLNITFEGVQYPTEGREGGEEGRRVKSISWVWKKKYLSPCSSSAAQEGSEKGGKRRPP